MIKKTSIIIAACNQLSNTKRCIEAILDNTVTPFELVIIDNGSTDGTCEHFQSISKAVHLVYIKNKENLGAIKALNQGIDASTSKYVCMLHNDAIIQERNWLGKMIDVMDADRKIGLVGLAGRQYIDNRGRVDDSTLVHGLTNRGLDTPPMAATAVEVAALDGLCFFSTKSIFEKVDKFDNAYKYMHTYDLDMSMKMMSLGYKNVVVNIKCFHINNGGNTRRSEDYKKLVGDDVELLNRNNKTFYKKWKRFLPVDKKSSPIVKN